jgi:Glyoxalase/Bleomycin resistance protein/Dioxygenase superfamily
MTTPLVPHYHVAIVVPDLDAAQAQMTEQLGVTWGPVLDSEALELRDGAGRDLVLPNKFCYSVEVPRLELIQEVPGSVWECNEHSNLHHIGFWSDDVVADSARLSSVGCPMQVCGRTGDVAPQTFAYHFNQLGVRIEVIDAALRDGMEFLFQPSAS